MKRTFSSLACMRATLPQLIEYAKVAGYDTLEVRLDKQDMICGIPKEQLPLELLQESGVRILDLGTGISLMGYAPEQIARGKLNADLAAYVGAKGIRLFIGGGIRTIHDVSNHDLNGIIRSVDELAAYAETIGVEVWLELHSWFSTGARIKPLLDGVNRSNVKIIWDVIHSVEHGEDPADTVAILGDAIAHVHIKDGKKSENPEIVPWVLTAHGAGNLPIRQVVQLLTAADYSGYYSLEWESAWHPELDVLYADVPALLAAYNDYMDAAAQ